eukprot:901821-Prorocentrum_lima.AAC.1
MCIRDSHLEDAHAHVMNYLVKMPKATEYYGLVMRDNTWVLSQHARRDIELYHSLLRLAYTTYHLH